MNEQYEKIKKQPRVIVGSKNRGKILGLGQYEGDRISQQDVPEGNRQLFLKLGGGYMRSEKQSSKKIKIEASH